MSSIICALHKNIFFLFVIPVVHTIKPGPFPSLHWISFSCFLVESLIRSHTNVKTFVGLSSVIIDSRRFFSSFSICNQALRIFLVKKGVSDFCLLSLMLAMATPNRDRIKQTRPAAMFLFKESKLFISCVFICLFYISLAA